MILCCKNVNASSDPRVIMTRSTLGFGKDALLVSVSCVIAIQSVDETDMVVIIANLI